MATLKLIHIVAKVAGELIGAFIASKSRGGFTAKALHTPLMAAALAGNRWAALECWEEDNVCMFQ